MIDVQPKEIVAAKLEVVIMQNGEIICLGKTLGQFNDLKKYLSLALTTKEKQNDRQRYTT